MYKLYIRLISCLVSREAVHVLCNGLFIILAIFCPRTAQAQAPVRDLRFVVVDSMAAETVAAATLLLHPADSLKEKHHALTDNQGEAQFRSLPFGEYKLEIAYIGYKTFFKQIEVGRETPGRDTLYLSQDFTQLHPITITDVANPVLVKQDTVEFTADAFPVAEGDALEQLLEKLPGIEIDANGAITANGQPVTKLLIDGKTFFLNDPAIASKNLPAKIIEKVRLVERKSKQAQFTGIDDGDAETVIDLTIRPGMMNGWFGSLSAGVGTDERFQAVGMAGKFTKTSQISLLASGNNTNNRGFSDLSGAALRTARNSATAAGNGRGIATSYMAGINGNNAYFKNKLKIEGSYLYSLGESELSQDRFRETYLKDSTFNRVQTSTDMDRTQGHKANMELEWNIAPKTSLVFTPEVNIGLGHSADTSANITRGGISGMELNSTTRSLIMDNVSVRTNGGLLLRQRFNKQGRTFSLNLTYSYSQNDIDAQNRSLTVMTKKNTRKKVDQQYTQNSHNYALTGRAAYTEPLGHDFFVELAYFYRRSESGSEKKTYAFNNKTRAYDKFDQTYSNYTDNFFENQRAELTLRKVHKKYSLNLGFNAQPSYTRSEGDKRSYSQAVINYAPTFYFNYKISPENSLSIRYRGTTTQPNINQIQPVPNNNNPTVVRLGNPNLRPEFANTLTLQLRRSNKKKHNSLTLDLNGGYTLDRIININGYTSGGVQYIIPDNAKGYYNMSTGLTYNGPLVKNRLYITNYTTGRFSNTFSKTATLDNSGFENDYIPVLADFTDPVTYNTKNLNLRENLRFNFKSPRVNASLGSLFVITQAWYDMEGKDDKFTTTTTLTGSVTAQLPWKFSMNQNFNYSFYTGFQNNDEPTMVWNIELSKLVSKGKGLFKLKVFDALGQTKSLVHTTTDTYYEDVKSNLLGRYAMFSFTYRFNKFDGGRKSASARPAQARPAAARPVAPKGASTGAPVRAN